MYYSVPYEYVREQVEIRLVDIGQYSASVKHMLDYHRLYLDPSSLRIAEIWPNVGPPMETFVDKILEENAEKIALSILRHMEIMDKNKSLPNWKTL